LLVSWHDEQNGCSMPTTKMILLKIENLCKTSSWSEDLSTEYDHLIIGFIFSNLYTSVSEKTDIYFLSSVCRKKFGPFQCKFKVNMGLNNKPRDDRSAVSLNTHNTFYSSEYLNGFMQSDLEQI